MGMYLLCSGEVMRYYTELEISLEITRPYVDHRTVLRTIKYSLSRHCDSARLILESSEHVP